jgi:hypothetical protein
MAPGERNVIAKLCREVDVGVAPIIEIVACIQRAPSKLVHQCLETAETDLRRADISPARRLVAVKFVVAALPLSRNVVARALERRAGPGDYETHFCLFCFLDAVQDVPGASEVAAEVPDLVGAYLAEVPRETARAAWMAGDLLGSHWGGEHAVRVLLRVAREGRYVAGRRGALHGLAHAASAVSGRRRGRILATVADRAKRDVSKRVRRYARYVLWMRELG